MIRRLYKKAFRNRKGELQSIGYVIINHSYINIHRAYEGQIKSEEYTVTKKRKLKGRTLLPLFFNLHRIYIMETSTGQLQSGRIYR